MIPLICFSELTPSSAPLEWNRIPSDAIQQQIPKIINPFNLATATTIKPKSGPTITETNEYNCVILVAALIELFMPKTNTEYIYSLGMYHTKLMKTPIINADHTPASLSNGKGNTGDLAYSERHQNETKNADNEKKTNDVQFPEQVDHDILPDANPFFCASSFFTDDPPVFSFSCLVSHIEEAADKRYAAQGKNKGPNTIAIIPRVRRIQRINNISRHPSIDNEGQGWNERHREPPVQSGEVSQDDAEHHNYSLEPNAVNHSTTSKGIDGFRAGADDGAHYIEQKRQNNEL